LAWKIKQYAELGSDECGVWQTTTLIAQWSRCGKLARWQRHEYEGYKPVVADVTAFWPSDLEKLSKQTLSSSRCVLCQRLSLGVGKVGEINGQRIALPQAFERVHPKDPSEKRYEDHSQKHQETLSGRNLVSSRRE